MMNIVEAMKVLMAVLQLITSMGLNVESTSVDGFANQIYTLKVNVSECEFTQGLASNQVYGFDKVSNMAAMDYNRSSSGGLDVDESLGYYDFGVNGGFYTELGRPAGIILIKGELVTKQNIGTPLFIIDSDGSVRLVDPELRIFIEQGQNSYESYELNEGQTDTLLSLYTPWYGNTNRLREDHTTIRVDHNQVIAIESGSEPDQIPFENGRLEDGSFLISYRSLRYPFLVKEGDQISLRIESNFNHENVKEAFQTGGWLVRDGENVSRDYESYVGITDSLQPRSAIGITAKQEVIIKVIDGRNKGVSEGVTGKALADLLIQDGCIYGAYLDGGASSVMVQNGKVINRPSLGEEKPVAHGLFFERDYQKVVAK
jgi:hypothetical protein